VVVIVRKYVFKMLLGVDTGGTFTDFVLFDGQNIRIHKVLSTPDSPERAILQGIKELGLHAAFDVFSDALHEAVPHETAPHKTKSNDLYIIHGSTVGTNAVLEGKGVRTAYIGNKGFRDLLTIGRQTRNELYNLRPSPGIVPVPEELCFEIDGRMSADGTELNAISEKCIRQLRKQLDKTQPQAVAINFLFSFLDDRHEREIEKIIPEGLYVSRSSDVLPEYKEYERGMATWLNAWIGPIMQRYLSQLNSSVKNAQLSIMQSSGGTIAADQAGKQAVHLLLSGPAGGLSGAQYMAGCSGYDQLLTFDMGGTSTDVAMINGELQLTSEGRIGPYPVAVPMLDLHTIGAGGGSIAFVDEGGLLHVGPESAGAGPGPACYGRGGNRATVTDANLILGRLQEKAFLGGKMPLNYKAAQAAINVLSRKLNLTTEQTAQGIIRVVNENMARALRVMSVQRGIEPTQLTLVSFGGAGGLHVCALAQALKISRAIIPVNAGVLSALGMIVAPRARFVSRSVMGLLEQYNIAQLEHYFDELVLQGSAALKTEGIKQEQINVRKSVDLRYHGQSYYLNIKWPEPQIAHSTLISFMAILCAEFHETHKRHYGHSLDQSIELVNIRVKVSGPQTELPNFPIKNDKRKLNKRQNKEVVSIETSKGLAIVNREELQPHDVIKGPALITEAVSTTYLEKGWQCEVDNANNLILEYDQK